jgi:hypothetical protein
MIIMQNPADDSYNPSLWTKVEFHDSSTAGFSYCMTVYNGATWEAALETNTLGSYNTSDATAGCNGFGHTITTNTNNIAPFFLSQSVALAGRWLGNYGTSFVVNNTMWLSHASWGTSHYTITQHTASQIIMQNPADDAYNPSLWTKVQFHSLGGGSYGYCMSVYDAATEAAALAADTSAIYNASDAVAGCNGFGHSIITPYHNPVAGSWLGNYGTQFTITDDTWTSVASWGTSAYTILLYTSSMIIMQNPADDSYNPSLWTKVEFHDSSTAGFSYCMTVYNGATYEAALSTSTLSSYNTSDAAAGCNGFGHTITTAN